MLLRTILIVLVMMLPKAQAMTAEDGRNLVITHTCLTVSSVFNDVELLYKWADSLNEIISLGMPSDAEVRRAVLLSSSITNTVQGMSGWDRLYVTCKSMPVDYERLFL